MTTLSGHLRAGLPLLGAGHPTVSRPVDGFRLAYDRSGDGPGVVLLHGRLGDRTDWTDVALRLDGTVVVPDLRGVGESDRRPGGDVSVPGQARSVLGLVDELRLGRVVLAGYGVGAEIAALLAARHPDRVAGVVLTPPPEIVGEPPSGAVPEILREAWTSWSGPAFRPSSTRLEHLAFQYRGAPAPMLGGGPSHAAPGVVTAPATVLWPLADPRVRPSWFDGLGSRFARVTVRGLPGIGHFAPVEAPADFVAAVHELQATAARG